MPIDDYGSLHDQIVLLPQLTFAILALAICYTLSQTEDNSSMPSKMAAQIIPSSVLTLMVLLTLTVAGRELPTWS